MAIAIAGRRGKGAFVVSCVGWRRGVVSVVLGAFEVFMNSLGCGFILLYEKILSEDWPQVRAASTFSSFKFIEFAIYFG